MNTSESQNPENTSRPFGYWLKAADRLMAAEFATAFDSEHASRREWRLLNIVDGTVASDRPLNGHKLHRLVERGWVSPEGEGWTLTDDGRAAKERLSALVDEIRTTVTEAVSPRTWPPRWPHSRRSPVRSAGTRRPSSPRTPARLRRPPPRSRLSPRLRRPFGRGFGCGPEREAEHGFGPHEDAENGCRHGEPGAGHRGHGRGHGHGGHGHGHGAHGPHRAERIAQHAFERGFDAGFTRGRDA